MTAHPDRNVARAAVGGAAPPSGASLATTVVPKTVDWYVQRRIKTDLMFTHNLSLEEIDRGLHLMHAGESIRSVVVY